MATLKWLRLDWLHLGCLGRLEQEVAVVGTGGGNSKSGVVDQSELVGYRANGVKCECSAMVGAWRHFMVIQLLYYRVRTAFYEKYSLDGMQG